jgi:hypothetical protein
MKRDMDLVRTLLRVVEAADQGKAYENHQLDVFSREVQYHLRLIVDAGLARCVGASSDGDVCIRLTWKGHELLELTRSDEIWNRAKHVVRDATGGMPFEAITSLLRRWALEAVGEDRPLRVVDQERAAAPQRYDKRYERAYFRTPGPFRVAVPPAGEINGKRTVADAPRSVADTRWGTRFDRPWEPWLGKTVSAPEIVSIHVA